MNKKNKKNKTNCGCGSKSYHLKHEDYIDKIYKSTLAKKEPRTEAETHPKPEGVLNHCCICDERSSQWACQNLDPIRGRGDVARRQKECRATGDKYGLPYRHVIGSDCGKGGGGNCKHTCWPAPESLAQEKHDLL